MKHIIGVIFLIIFSATDILTGRVIRVADGDTITILLAGNIQERIRLADIDAPELGQPFSEQSRLYLSELCAGKTVTIEYKERDIYGRILGVVIVDGINVNEAIVREGLAWEYKYNTNGRIRELQEEAQLKKINIWSDENPVNPYDYRREKNK